MGIIKYITYILITSLSLLSFPYNTNGQAIRHISVFSHYHTSKNLSIEDSVESINAINHLLHRYPGTYIIHDTISSLILNVFDVDENRNRITLLAQNSNQVHKECYLPLTQKDSEALSNINALNEIRLVGYKGYQGRLNIEFSSHPSDSRKLDYHNCSSLPYEKLKKYVAGCYWFSKMNLNNNCYITLGYGRKLRKIKVFKVCNIEYRKVKIEGVDTPLYDLYSYQINGHTFQNYNYIVLCKNNRHLRRYEKYNSKYLVPSCD